MWTWFKAVRLQFYPMTGLAYAIGAFCAAQNGYGFEATLFWLGYLFLLFGEIATVFTNEYFDFTTDKENKYFGPFNGGSRVLVDNLLSFGQLKKGIFVTLGLSLILLGVLLFSFSGPLAPVAFTCAFLYVLALGYTAPPFRFSYRGLGELDVSITHSFVVVLCGYLFQGGHLRDALPWLLSLPLCFSIIPSIILAGVPDYEADKAAQKRTLAVKLGKRKAVLLALAFTWLAALVVLMFKFGNIYPEVFGYLIWTIIPHAILLTFLIIRYLQKGALTTRIDGLMVASLSYLFWFILIPFINLL